ncbi:hypothetical protein FNV43_RR02240 [Rhamnella rubrinervis]|uniref:Uncharacterized protein n=1 Tax=Rhamnella rubrinervis TaxID=2594499 RepID=A0A8K0MT23_9ROSA|nr:hypothetical protein FNV43_RR02240 [Rhamnella rubrinervis]
MPSRGREGEGKKNKKVDERHAHPGSPYVFGLVGVDHNLDFPEPMPVIDMNTRYHKKLFWNVTVSSENRPRALTLGTATQIGYTLFVEDVASNFTGLPVLYVRDLPLNPPAYEIASSIQESRNLVSVLLEFYDMGHASNSLPGLRVGE